MKAIYENHYLTDNDVANYARQSFGKLAENFSEADNNGLVRFLARGMKSKDWDKLVDEMRYTDDPDKRHALAVYLRSIPEHWVPFGHPHITLRMSAPVPITVQCYKHKIGFVESGESRRYVSHNPSAFVPDVFRAKAESVKQGSGDAHPSSGYYRMRYMEQVNQAITLYEDMIAKGVCPEQARFVLPQGIELNWVWTGSLYAYANFYNQRSDSHSQKEIQELADQVGKIIAPLFPVSWAALTAGDY